MKLRYVISLGAVISLLSACIPSIAPFYLEQDVQFDPRLVGIWHGNGTEGEWETWEFEKADDTSYKLTVTEKGGKPGTFIARLFKLKEELFVDILPLECTFDSNQAELVGCAMFPGHLLVRAVQIGPKLKLAFCNYEWLGKHLEENPKDVAHHIENKRAILTAKTADLQRFVMAHLAEGQLFSAPDEFIQKTGAAAPSAKP